MHINTPALAAQRLSQLLKDINFLSPHQFKDYKELCPKGRNALLTYFFSLKPKNYDMQDVALMVSQSDVNIIDKGKNHIITRLYQCTEQDKRMGSIIVRILPLLNLTQYIKTAHPTMVKKMQVGAYLVNQDYLQSRGENNNMKSIDTITILGKININEHLQYLIKSMARFTTERELEHIFTNATNAGDRAPTFIEGLHAHNLLTYRQQFLNEQVSPELSIKNINLIINKMNDDEKDCFTVLALLGQKNDKEYLRDEAGKREIGIIISQIFDKIEKEKLNIKNYFSSIQSDMARAYRHVNYDNKKEAGIFFLINYLQEEEAGSVLLTRAAKYFASQCSLEELDMVKRDVFKRIKDLEDLYMKNWSGGGVPPGQMPALAAMVAADVEQRSNSFNKPDIFQKLGIFKEQSSLEENIKAVAVRTDIEQDKIKKHKL